MRQNSLGPLRGPTSLPVLNRSCTSPVHFISLGFRSIPAEETPEKVGLGLGKEVLLSHCNGGGIVSKTAAVTSGVDGKALARNL